MWFDVVQQYGDLGMFFFVILFMSIILYFVISFDSGFFVIDCFLVNGDLEFFVVQWIFWVLMEGVIVIVLLNVGGEEGFVVLQLMLIVFGVFYMVFLCFMCVVLWCVVKMEGGDFDLYGLQFSISFLDVLSSLISESVSRVVLVIFVFWYLMGNVVYKISGKNEKL